MYTVTQASDINKLFVGYVMIMFSQSFAIWLKITTFFADDAWMIVYYLREREKKRIHNSATDVSFFWLNY